MSDHEERVLRLVGSQLGLITRADAHTCGLTDRQIQHRLDSGRWVRVFAGVYRYNGVPVTHEQTAMAACLATGPGAVASHGTAAALWGFVESANGVHVTVPTTRRPRTRGIVAHRADLRAHERSRTGPVPVTAPVLTLAQLPTSVPIEDLDLAVDRSLRAGFIDPDRLVRYLEHPRFIHSPGIATIRALAADRARRGVPGSELETLFVRLIARYRLPEPVRQVVTETPDGEPRVDFVYPTERVIVELDGRKPHAGQDRWQSDLDRETDLEQDGWMVRRVTWYDVTRRPDRTAMTIARDLGLRPGRWVPDRGSATRVGNARRRARRAFP